MLVEDGLNLSPAPRQQSWRNIVSILLTLLFLLIFGEKMKNDRAVLVGVLRIVGMIPTPQISKQRLNMLNFSKGILPPILIDFHPFLTFSMELGLLLNDKPYLLSVLTTPSGKPSFGGWTETTGFMSLCVPLLYTLSPT